MAVYLAAIVFGLMFGGADQYLGSRITLGPWASSVSAMSAPWLALPFVFGWAQLERRRAIVVGLTVTVAALAGYFAMTLSPVEGVALGRFPGDLVALARSNLRNIVGGLLTGPLFGALGWRWRTARSWASAALLAAAFCLEPVARLAVGQLFESRHRMGRRGRARRRPRRLLPARRPPLACRRRDEDEPVIEHSARLR